MSASKKWAVGREGTLSVEFSGQVIPVLQADLEDLLLLNYRNQNQIVQSLGEKREEQQRDSLLPGNNTASSPNKVNKEHEDMVVGHSDKPKNANISA